MKIKVAKKLLQYKKLEKILNKIKTRIIIEKQVKSIKTLKIEVSVWYCLCPVSITKLH